MYDIELLGVPDSLSVLSKSMRKLTDMADRLADPLLPQPSAKRQKLSEVKRGDGGVELELALQPSFDVRETKEGVLVVGSMPGLRKDDLSVEIVETADGNVLEVSGESKTQEPATSDKDKGADKSSTSPGPSSPAPVLRSSYLKFHRQFLLPKHIDPKTLHAKYRDGLLLVTIGRRSSKDEAGRVKYTIEG